MTPPQKQCLDFIRAYVVKHGVAPTVREIQAGTGRKSTSSTAWLLDCLEESGHIKRTQRKRRNIEVVSSNDNPDTWVQVGTAALKVVNAIRSENIDEITGKGTVTVDATAFGDLDVALAEALEPAHGYGSAAVRSHRHHDGSRGAIQSVPRGDLPRTATGQTSRSWRNDRLTTNQMGWVSARPITSPEMHINTGESDRHQQVWETSDKREQE